MSSHTWKARIYLTALMVVGLSAPFVSWFITTHPNRLRAFLEGAVIAAAAAYCIHFARRLYRDQMAQERRHGDEMAHLYLSVIEALALAIDSKDRFTQRRLRRMQTFAVELGRLMGLERADLEALRAGALLHDIGKLAVPEYILCKPGRLTVEEFEKMAIHPRVGAEILERVRFPYPVARVVRSHHEKYDGTGYPDGLKGEAIPLPARILSVVDSFDALTSERPYRHPLSRDEAIAQVQKESGTSFDPEVVRLLVTHLDRLELLAAEEARTLESTQPRGIAADGTTAAPSDPAPLSAATARTIATVHQETSGLYEIARGMNHSLNLDESMTRLSETIARLVHHRHLIVFLHDRVRGLLRARHVTGQGAERVVRHEIPLGERTSGLAAKQRTPVVFRPNAPASAAGGVAHDFADQAGAIDAGGCALAVPLLDGDDLLGVLALYDASQSPYAPTDARTLTAVAGHLAEAVRNTVLYERIQQSALTDPLTRLPNARFLFGSFDQEMARAERLGVPLSIIEIDVNQFKSINDHFGHPAGDRVLRGVARAIRSQLRPNDTCVRYAGDEFIVTVPGVGAAGIEAVLARIEVAIARHKFAVARGRMIQVTVSMGAASYPEDGRVYDALISVADARMYQQKFTRRGAGPAEPLHPHAFTGRQDFPVN